MEKGDGGWGRGRDMFMIYSQGLFREIQIVPHGWAKLGGESQEGLRTYSINLDFILRAMGSSEGVRLGLHLKSLTIIDGDKLERVLMRMERSMAVRDDARQ